MNTYIVREHFVRSAIRFPEQATFDPKTGRKISPFDVPELLALGLSVEHAMWLVMGIPLDTDPVRLRSVDGFTVRFAS